MSQIEYYVHDLKYNFKHSTLFIQYSTSCQDLIFGAKRKIQEGTERYQKVQEDTAMYMDFHN